MGTWLGLDGCLKWVVGEGGTWLGLDGCLKWVAGEGGYMVEFMGLLIMHCTNLFEST